MDFITIQDRFQISLSSLEDKISVNNPVRFVDAFVGHLDLSKLGFIINTLKTEGRPSLGGIFERKHVHEGIPPHTVHALLLYPYIFSKSQLS